MIWVTDAQYVSDYKVRVSFSNGRRLVVDLKEHLDGGVFEELKDSRAFAGLRYDADVETVVWENGADFAPEFLYQLGHQQAEKETRSAG